MCFRQDLILKPITLLQIARIRPNFSSTMLSLLYNMEVNTKYTI
jgi:hypothetical protein